MLDKKTFTIDEIEKLPESKLVVFIDGGIYDLTEFVNIHPGGREILEKFNRKDASKAFQLVHHSAEAIQMLPKYCMGVLAGYENQFNQTLQSTFKKDSFFANVRKKLITHEDHFHIHKILGSLVIGHFLVRIVILMVGTVIYLYSGNREIFHLNKSLDPAWLLITMALVHGALSLSSLQFFVPKKASQSKPMIHDLFRAHSITFALRAVACMLLYVLIQEDYALRNLLISLVVFSALISADVITHKLTAPGDRFDTTASMPYWFGISVKRQQVHKFLYGYAQFLATLVCMFGGYAGALYTLAPIQGAAFGMTLTRKNILSAHAHHNIYLALLFLPVPFAFFLFPIRVTVTLLVTLILFYLRTLGVNKYVLWVPGLILFNLAYVPEEYWKPFFLGCAFLSISGISINLFVLKFKKPQRVDKNNRLIERKIISEDAFEITIRTKFPMTILPGQHVLIRLSDKLERKYSPVASTYLAETDQTLLNLRIKLYEHESYQTASSYLSTCPIGTVLDCHGPIGEKFYCTNSKSIVDRIQGISVEPEKNSIYLCSAGSGITPIYQLAKAMCEARQTFSLITCDKTPEHLMMKHELIDLKKQYAECFDWISIFSQSSLGFQNANQVIQGRLDSDFIDTFVEHNNDKVVIICGPEQWQRLITTTLNKRQDTSLKQITW